MNSKELLLLEKRFIDNKMSHACLIETNNQDFCVKELINLVKRMSCLEEYKENCTLCNLCKTIEENVSLNLFIIEPDGKNIKKEQVIELKNKCSTIPVLSKNNIYIIKNAECMNNSSANTMLKFIEEPLDNLYGFFVTNSKENIINTIRSRCELINVKYDVQNLFENIGISENLKESYLDICKNYIYKIEVEKKLGILYNKLIITDDLKNKESLERLFKLIDLVYEKVLENKLNISNDSVINDFSFLNNLSIYNIIDKRKIINEIIFDLKYNLNMDLLLDRFIIEIGGLND